MISFLGICSDDEPFIMSNALFIELLAVNLSVNVLSLKVEFLVFSLALEVFVVARVVAISKIGAKVDNGFNAFSGMNSSSGSSIISVLAKVIGLIDEVLVNDDGVVVDIKDVEILVTGCVDGSSAKNKKDKHVLLFINLSQKNLCGFFGTLINVLNVDFSTRNKPS